MNITNRVEKVDEKNGVICLVFMFPSRVMVLKLSKNKSVKTIYIYASERSCLLCFDLLFWRYKDLKLKDFFAELAFF